MVEQINGYPDDLWLLLKAFDGFCSRLKEYGGLWWWTLWLKGDLMALQVIC